MRPLVILSELSPKPRRETSLAFFFSARETFAASPSGWNDRGWGDSSLEWSSGALWEFLRQRWPGAMERATHLSHGLMHTRWHTLPVLCAAQCENAAKGLDTAELKTGLWTEKRNVAWCLMELLLFLLETSSKPQENWSKVQSSTLN